MSSIHTDYIASVMTTGEDLSAADAYIIGEPCHLTLSYSEYQQVLAGDIEWASRVGHETVCPGFSAIGRSGMVIVNKGNASSNSDFVGRYVTVSDNTGLQPTDPHENVINIKSFKQDEPTTWTDVPSDILSFTLSGDDSLSETLKGRDTSQGGSFYNDSITVDVIDIKVYNQDVNKLTYELSERHTGSLDFYHTEFDHAGGKSKIHYLESIVDRDSNEVSVLINPHLSKNPGTWRNANNLPVKSVRVFRGTNQTYGEALGDETERLADYTSFVHQNSLLDVSNVSATSINEELLLSGFMVAISSLDKLSPGNNLYNLSKYSS
jgi:hypothetical protein